MPSPLAALKSGLDYLRKNPGEIFYLARQAAGLKVVIPLDVLRWAIANLPTGKRAPKDVVIGFKTPALTIAATVDLMGTEVRAGAAIRVDQLQLSADALRVTIRLGDVALKVLSEAATPVAALIKSGALDLSKPGNLANYLPQKPPALVEAKDDRLVIDLLKVPKLAENFRLRRLLGVVTPVLEVKELRVEDDHILITWRPRPSGLVEAVNAIK